MTAWQVVTVEHLCSRVTSGGTPSRSKPEYYEPGDHLWVKSKELLDSSVSDTEELISDAGLKGSSAKPIRPNSVLMAMYGANVGQLGWLKVPATVNQAICAMETDPDETDARWLFYSLMHWRPALTAQAHGAAQQNLSQGLIRKFAVPTPPLAIQRKIASILAAYDELMENNLRQIEILEEMGETLYREWFLNLRFPGHEVVDLVDSPLGPIPDGWVVSTLDSVADATRGLSWSRDRETVAGAGAPVMTIPNIGRHLSVEGATRLSDVTTREWEQFGLAKGDLLIIGSNGNPERVGQTVPVPDGTEALFGSFLMRVRSKSHSTSPRLLHFQLRDRQLRTQLQASAVGATSLRNIRITSLRSALLTVPSPEVLTSFDSIVDPILSLSDLLLKMNTNLRSTRDFLLPKLISGALDVSNLDIDTDWLVA